MEKKITKKKVKKEMSITQKEHDDWHRKNGDYSKKTTKEHERCHKEMGIIIKKK